MNNIFKAIVGSQAYGTNTPESDIDYKGVYRQSNNEILGFNYKQQIEVGKDEVYYEIKRFIELLQTANPTVLELLYTPADCIITQSHEWEILSSYRSLFLTKKCLNSFGGYAVQQIQKAKGLNKKINWEKEKITKKDILDFCYVYENGKTINLKDYLKRESLSQEFCGLVKLDHFRDTYALYYDYQSQYGQQMNRIVTPMGYRGLALENGTGLRLSEVPKYASAINILYWNKDAFTIHCRDWNSYETWLKERNEQRYIDTKNHGQKIDGKNLLHCRRLLDVAKEIATLKTINVRRPNAEYLLSIRKGQVNLEDLIKQAEEDILLLNDIYKKCDLPDDVDKSFCNTILLNIRHYSK